MMASINLDFSSLSSTAGYLVRFLPTIEVLLFYFLLPYIYHALNEKQEIQSAQTALQQNLASTKKQAVIQNGLPDSDRNGHGYGCYNIHTIVQRNGGLCSFDTENGLFTLRLIFPLPADSGN